VKDLVTNRGALLVDVRTKAEFDAGHIDGAINIPVEDIQSDAASFSSLDKARPIVVYCRRGVRAGAASQILCAAGYKVYDLGAMSNWPA
jgi:phage shock protein E